MRERSARGALEQGLRTLLRETERCSFHEARIEARLRSCGLDLLERKARRRRTCSCGRVGGLRRLSQDQGNLLVSVQPRFVANRQPPVL